MTRGQEQSIEQRLEERVYLSMLYDFYGALLKENNRRIFEAYIQEDYSISEIAEEMEISRQAVRLKATRRNWGFWSVLSDREMK
ncbi:MAG: hypothetical protein BHW06_11195 [Clostridium sp. 44_14]|nr:MAG: hypothetical protein BHW06_11195 [Clostridium sp. 44_14]